jgi:hypothetical protein
MLGSNPIKGKDFGIGSLTIYPLGYSFVDLLASIENEPIIPFEDRKENICLKKKLLEMKK